MKTPILKIGPDLIVSLQGAMTDTDTEEFQRDVLAELNRTGLDGLILDISPMDIVDSFMARVLNDTMRMAGLLGTTVVVVGMSPSVAVTLTQMGRRLIGVEAALNLEQGLAKLHTLRRRKANPW